MSLAISFFHYILMPKNLFESIKQICIWNKNYWQKSKFYNKIKKKKIMFFGFGISRQKMIIPDQEVIGANLKHAMSSDVSGFFILLRYDPSPPLKLHPLSFPDTPFYLFWKKKACILKQQYLSQLSAPHEKLFNSENILSLVPNLTLALDLAFRFDSAAAAVVHVVTKEIDISAYDNLSIEEKLLIELAGLEMTVEQKVQQKDLIPKLKLWFCPVFPGCQLLPFGLRVTGLATRESDLDVCLHISHISIIYRMHLMMRLVYAV